MKNEADVYARVDTIGVTLMEVDPEAYVPARRDWFCINCTVYFGNTARVGANIHTLSACSPSWLVDNLPVKSVLRGQGLILMQQYDGRLLKEAVSAFAGSCRANDIGRLYQKLERFGFSEFEDYNEPPLPRFFIDPEHDDDSLGTSEPWKRET